MYLNVAFKEIFYNQDKGTIKIRGTIRDGWSKKDFNPYFFREWNTDKSVKIFVGKKKDTVNKIYYEPYLSNSSNLATKGQPYTEKEYTDGSRNKYIIKHNGTEIKQDAVLDSFPSFYLDNYLFYNTNSGDIREFNIEVKIDRNSLLIFSLEYCYSEIFEIGKMVFDDTNTRKQKVKLFRKQKQNKTTENFKVIIRNNIQELYKDTITKPEVPWYYQRIEAAENFIYKRKYKAASDQYSKIVERDHYIYARDIHNAVRAAILSRDYDTAIKWCEKIALKGVPLTYFNAEIFNPLKKKKSWNSFLEEYPKHFEKYKDGLNLRLIDKLEELVAMDQKDYGRHAKGGFERSKLYATTEKVNDLFIPLLNIEGFPSEEKVGATIIQDTLISLSKAYYVLINHSHQANSSRLLEIQNLMEKGSKNFEYDKYRNNLNKYTELRTCFMLYKGNLYRDKTCSEQTNMLEKIKYSTQNNYGFILDQGDVSALGYNKENEVEDTKFMNDNFIFIMKLTDEMYLSN